MPATMEMWRIRKPQRRKCQFCKQQRDCTRGPDPFLFNFYDEIEIVWLCDECFSLREYGDHLDDGEELEE